LVYKKAREDETGTQIFTLKSGNIPTDKNPNQKIHANDMKNQRKKNHKFSEPKNAIEIKKFFNRHSSTNSNNKNIIILL
jgi:hypothetical protein